MRRWSFVGAVALFGCVETADGLLGLGEPGADGGPGFDAQTDAGWSPDAGEGRDRVVAPDAGDDERRSVFDPEATLAPPRPVTVFQPTEVRPVMQGSGVELVATPGGYLLFWVENRYAVPEEGSNLRAVVQEIGPDLAPGPRRPLRPDPIDPERDPLEGAPRAVWDPASDRVALAWITRRRENTGRYTGTVQIAWTDADGALVEGPVVAREVEGPNAHYAHHMFTAPDGDGYVLFGTDWADADHGLRVTRLDARGALVDFFVVPDVFGDASAAPEGRIDVGSVRRGADGWWVTWSERQPGADDRVGWARLDRGYEVVERQVVLTEDSVAAGPIWPDAAPRFMAAASSPDTLQLFGADGTRRRDLAGRFWSRFAVEPGGRRLGILALDGEADGGLPTGLAYRAWDPDADVLAPSTRLQAGGRGCIEAVVAAPALAASGRLGVAWVLSCETQRMLMFAELRD